MAYFISNYVKSTVSNSSFPLNVQLKYRKVWDECQNVGRVFCCGISFVGEPHQLINAFKMCIFQSSGAKIALHVF